MTWLTAADMEGAATALDAGQGLLPSAGSPSWAREAAETVGRFGFVAVLGVAPTGVLTRLLRSARDAAEAMLVLDPARLGNRGPRRYSYGGASRFMHIMTVPPWPELLDIVSGGPIADVLGTLLPEGVVAAGGGGDFVLGNTDTFQSLHADVRGGAFHELHRPPAVAVNFVVEDLTCEGGPLRVIPGTHRREDPPPTLDAEPPEQKGAILCPLPAGSVIIRDLRAWHGGTPNAAGKIRYLPNVELVDATWRSHTCGKGGYLDPCSPVLPESAYRRLTTKAQAISSDLVDQTGELQEALPTNAGSWLIRDFARATRHSEDSY